MSHSIKLRRAARARTTEHLLLTILALVVFDSVSAAAEATAPAAEPVVELEAAAKEAEEVSRLANAAAAEAEAAAQAARAAVDRANGVTPAAATSSTLPASEATDDALHRATEAAENAAAAARAATAALQEFERERAHRYSRNGVVLIGGIFWAPEIFQTSYSVGNSNGGDIALGFHFADHFEVDFRFEYLNDFDLSGYGNRGSYTAWSTTLNGRFYPLTNQIQPYLGFGIGVLEGTTFLQDVATGYAIEESDVVAVFRFSGGVDYYVSRALALTADISIVVPGGNLTNATYATLGGGLKVRF
jgi:hypothetical protein